MKVSQFWAVVVSLEDPLVLSTVAKIEDGLRSGGHVHRYVTDTYMVVASGSY